MSKNIYMYSNGLVEIKSQIICYLESSVSVSLSYLVYIVHSKHVLSKKTNVMCQLFDLPNKYIDCPVLASKF